MANCAVSIAAKDATGAALAGAKIVFTPLPGDALRAQDAGVIWPTPIAVTCDGSGLATVTLKTGTYAYQTIVSQRSVNGRIVVPDLVATSLDVLIGAAEPPYATVTWAEYQTLVSATPTPYATVAAGLAAVSDGATYLAQSDDGVSIIRRVAGAAVPAFVEL